MALMVSSTVRIVSPKLRTYKTSVEMLMSLLTHLLICMLDDDVILFQSHSRTLSQTRLRLIIWVLPGLGILGQKMGH